MTILGSTPILSTLTNNSNVTTKRQSEVTSDKKLDDLCSLSWSLEVLGIRSDELETADEMVIRNFRETVRKENGRFVVRWPWKTENPSIPSNYRLSIARLRQTIERNTTETLQRCDSNFKEQLQLGIIEQPPVSSPYLKHYIPWKAVLRNGKIRVVMLQLRPNPVAALML